MRPDEAGGGVISCRLIAVTGRDVLADPFHPALVRSGEAPRLNVVKFVAGSIADKLQAAPSEKSRAEAAFM